MGGRVFISVGYIAGLKVIWRGNQKHSLPTIALLSFEFESAYSDICGALTRHFHRRSELSTIIGSSRQRKKPPTAKINEQRILLPRLVQLVSLWLIKVYVEFPRPWRNGSIYRVLWRVQQRNRICKSMQHHPSPLAYPPASSP